jgi:GNAT superfamily N-acetyltransferase
LTQSLADASILLFLSLRDDRLATLSMQRPGKADKGPQAGPCDTCGSLREPEWTESRRTGDRWSCPVCHVLWPIVGDTAGSRSRPRVCDRMIEGVSTLQELGAPLEQVPRWPRRVLVGYAQLARFEGALRSIGVDPRQRRHGVGELAALLGRIPAWERQLMGASAVVLAEHGADLLRRVEVLGVAFRAVFPRRTGGWSTYRVRMDLRDGRRRYEEELERAGVPARWRASATGQGG